MADDSAPGGKRPIGEAEGGAPKRERKRSRWGQAPAADAAAAAAAPPASAAAAPMDEASIKAKKLAELQAKIQAQMAAAMGAAAAPAMPAAAPMGFSMPAAMGGVGSMGTAAAQAVKGLSLMGGPAEPGRPGGAMSMDAEGNLVDSAGQVIQASTQRSAVTSLKVNMRDAKGASFKVEKGYIEKDREKNPFYDPRVNSSKLYRSGRKGAMKFQGIDIKAGAHVKAAERMRAKVAEQEFEEEMAAVTREKKAAGLDPGMDLDAEDDEEPGSKPDPDADANTSKLGSRKSKESMLPEVPPAVEWWDGPYLANRSYEDVLDGTFSILGDKITQYIEHPVEIIAPSEKDKEAVAVPLFLTKQERKKLRTKKRVERQRDLQDQIRMGLIQAPDNKLKISNFMKSLVTDAVQDPTKIEASVRKQMKERQKAHEKRNTDRRLSEAERKEKKMIKVETDKKEGTHVAVFKVNDLSSKKNRYKVDINASENHLTGVVVHSGHFTVVIAEGGTKALKRYKKLMLRRIDWTMKYQAAAVEGDEGGGEDEEDEEAEQARLNNKCVQVWEGTVLKPTFYNFRTENCASASMARKFLNTHGVAHYWDMAMSFHTDEIMGDN